MIKTIYFLSGLGADERIFQYLKINCPNIVYIKWIIPEKGESYESYLIRLQEQIKDREDFAIAGVSFGGITAVELSKTLKPAKTIIISSVKSPKEMPLIYKLIGKTGLVKIFPFRLAMKFPRLAFRSFGTKSNDEKALLVQLLREADPWLVEWSIDKVLTWKNSSMPENLFHLHGTKDLVFPPELICDATMIKDGTHFMVLGKADEVSEQINRILLSE